MKITPILAMAIAITALFITACSRTAPAPDDKAAVQKQQPTQKYLTADELVADLGNPPQNAIERADKLAQLFNDAGITNIVKQKVRVERQPSGEYVYMNIIATLPGQTSNTVVLSSHTDASTEGKGVIDDWSGACMLINLAKTFKDANLMHTFIFLGATLEEKGLIGSQFYAKSLSPVQVARIKAMIELECLGVSKTKVWTTGSADELEALAADVAKQNNIPIRLRELVGVNADSASFSARHIPTITIDSLDESDFPLIDSPRDSFESINKQNYAEQYKFLVNFIKAVDAHPSKFSPANREKSSLTTHASVLFAPDADELAKSGNVIVGEVFVGGPEEKAGLSKGDRIVEFGGSTIAGINDLAGRIRVLKAGEQVKVQVKRGTETVELSIQY